MLLKRLEKKADLFPDESSSELNAPIELEYYLLESTAEDSSDLAGNVLYGIEIVKKLNQNSFESEIVKNLSCCRDSVRELINRLAAHTVTPVSLYYILDDLLGT